MKRFLFIVVFIPLLSSAQRFPFEFWHDGRVFLESGDTLKGQIKYDLNDLLQLKHDNRLESFSARKVLSFEIFDNTYKRYRTFYSLPYSPSGGYKSPVFFESVAEGKITVLSRERIEYRSYSTPYGFGSYSSRMVLVDNYFILKENGDIEPFSGRKNDWYDLMASHENQVHDFVKENRLDFEKKYQLKQIIEYYNSFYNHK
jgi:hypothetical protein